MKLVFFFENTKKFVEIAKMQENFKRMFCIFALIALEPVAGITLIDDENTCDPQSTSYEKILRFRI